MVKKTILNDKPEVLIKKYKQLLEKEGTPVEKIILFGSYAKGNAKPWSDIDICVISKKFGRSNYDETVFLKKLTSEIDSMLEPHPYHPDDLKNPFDPLASEIKKTGKVIY
ncbi:nucleotidyltransferase domain-containing protein [Candidatus Microgenomates bacterium]|nr:nucleotidyltransferase domain-containing protein [Candidatus Microgenomates bacterium]